MAAMRWLTVLLAATLGAGIAAAAPQDQASEPNQASLVQGNSQFALDLYARLAGRAGNVAFSPYSVSNALAMTYAGARGPTAAQMAAALHFPLEGDRLHQAFGKIVRELNRAGAPGRSELYVANALWPQTGLQLAPGFRAIVRDAYGAGLQAVDFERTPEKARTAINAWVEQQTRDRIKDLVPEGGIQRDTALVLTNAIYFKGKWMQAFQKAATRDGTFAMSSRASVDVPLMNQQGSFAYLDGGSFQALTLPYEAGELSMIVFLPKTVDGLAEFERTLSAARVTDWLSRMPIQQVNVTLPRFRVTAQFELREALSGLGMRLPFAPGQADFSGIATGRPLVLSAVFHKTFVDVNEQGTEAAAATAPVVQTTSMPPPRPVFRADHPFFFLIRDDRTGSPLFLGRVVDPRAG